MKKSCIKALCCILVLAMALSILGACGTGDESVASSSAGTAVSTVEDSAVQVPPAEETQIVPSQVESSAEEPTVSVQYPITDGAVLTSWGSINANLASFMDSVSDNAVIQEVGKRTGVELKATSVPSDVVSEQFSLMIAGGDYADLIDNVASFYASKDAAVDDGILVDLAPYVQENAPDYYAVLSSDDAWLRMATTDSGYMPLFCMITENVNALTGSGYLIRQDWLDDLSLDMPTTRDELHDVLTAFKNEKNASAPMWFNSNGLGLIAEASGVYANYEPMGGFYPFYVKDETVCCGYFDDSFQDYLITMQKWFQEGLIWKDFMSDTFCFGINSSNGLSLLSSGNMGVAYGEMTDISSLPQQATDTSMVLAAMPDPTLDGSPNHMSVSGSAVGYKHGISTACKDIELACKYINYFYTDEGYELCSYGLEGQAFTYDDSGDKIYTELLTDNPNGLSYDNAFEIYCLSDFSCRVDGSRKLQLYDETTLNASAVWSGCRDYAYNYPKGATLSAEENEQFNSVFTDINTYVGESILAFITGDLDIAAEWDNFQQTLKKMGIEDALALKQTSYQRYIER